MAHTLLLQSSTSFLQNPKFQHYPPHNPLRLFPSFKPSIINPKSTKPLKLTLNSYSNSQNYSNSHLGFKEKTLSSIGYFLDSILSALRALKKPAMAAVLVGLLLMCDPNWALAAGVGRMGGQSFSRRSSVSSSRGYSVGLSSPSFSYSVPYYAPSPFGGGGGGGFFVGPALGFGFGVSSLVWVMMGLAAFGAVSGLLTDRTDDGVLTASDKTTVVKLQVGLLGMARSLQRDLNMIAESADTSTPEGLSYVLTETILALLRHPDYCISAYSSVDVKKSIEDGEKKFNQLSIEERGKFDEETLVNVNNIKRQSSRGMRPTGFSNEYIVITILVAAEGIHKLPAINGGLNLREALQKLGSIPSSKIMAVEVLWTPQNEDDTLSERELLEDYSLLKAL